MIDIPQFDEMVTWLSLCVIRNILVEEGTTTNELEAQRLIILGDLSDPAFKRD
jgi:hypothetical protein